MIMLQFFTCVEGKIPFRYLGAPLNFVRLCNLDWGEAEEKMDKRLMCGNGSKILTWVGWSFLDLVCAKGI
jgi:hypothetical protein